MNLPQKIRIISAENNTIAHLYDASGTKMAKQTKTDGSPLDQTDYIANFVYENNQLQFILTSEGRIMMQNEETYEYQYFLKDHLGNTRITMNQNGTLLQEDAYYPYGTNIKGLSYNNSCSENKYKYNGKELQDEFGLDWYDYGARMYDASIGRWHVSDPKTEEREWLSPFNYVQNNPLGRIDPNGAKDLEFDDAPDPRDEDDEDEEFFITIYDEYGDPIYLPVGGSTGGKITTKKSKKKSALSKTAKKLLNPWSKGKGYGGVTSLSESVDASSNVSGISIATNSGDGWHAPMAIDDVGNAASYASGAIGLTQIGMLEYRMSLPIMSKVGTFSSFASKYGTFGKFGGGLGYAGAGISLISNISEVRSGEIGLGRFSYRLGSLGASIGVGAAIGGSWGAVGAAAVGGISTGFEYIYDNILVPLWNETNRQIYNFENAIKNGWYPGR